MFYFLLGGIVGLIIAFLIVYKTFSTRTSLDLYFHETAAERFEEQLKIQFDPLTQQNLQTAKEEAKRLSARMLPWLWLAAIIAGLSFASLFIGVIMFNFGMT